MTISPSSPHRFHLSVLAAGALLALVAIVVSIAYNPGWAHEEGYVYIVNYLRALPMFRLVLDLKANDVAWLFRSRELSFLFDYFNAHLVHVSLMLGMPRVISWIHYLAMFTLMVMHTRFIRKAFGSLSAAVVLLPSLLFLSTPHAVFTTYSRTAKDVTAVAALFLCWQCYFTWSQASSKVASDLHPIRSILHSKRFWLFFLVGLATTLLDEQGRFFVMLCAVAMVGIFLLTRTVESCSALLGLGGALGGQYLYQQFIGRVLIYRVTGFRPYPVWEVDYAGFFKDPRGVLQVAWKSVSTHLSYLLGNSRGLALAILAVCALWLAGRVLRRLFKADEPWPQTVLPLIFLLAVASAMMVLHALMFIKHPPAIVDPHWSRVCYGLPGMSFLLFSFTLFWGRGLMARPRWQWPLTVFALMLLVLNIRVLPTHRTYLPQHLPGETNGVTCIRDPQVAPPASYGLPPYEMEFCRRMRKIMRGQLTKEMWNFSQPIQSE